VGTNSEVEQMIGNAVLPELVQRVALALKAFLSERGFWQERPDSLFDGQVQCPSG
jgi:hypothetical protein